jgi:aminoglycoside phosphotransferase family enzyme/predicted kinase
MDQFDISAVQPASFAHAVSQLDIVETHLSWIVLTGDFAYKIKKAIKVDFVDTTDLEHRRLLCHEELRLNRRFAPDLYLDVVPIVRARGILRFGGEGTPIEYALRMRQFDRNESLSNLLNDGISPAELADLARIVAAFHATADVCAPTDAPARTQRIERIMLDNINALEELLQRNAAVTRVGQVSERLCASIVANDDSIEARERAGFIRECHGDLHTGNVVRYRGRLTPFDCLEFDADLRRIDVIDDVAFLVMDLVSRDRAGLAHVFLSSYLEATGDYRALQLVPLYAVHRALVRAKVDALALRHSSSGYLDHLRQFQRHLQTAESWSQRGVGTLVLMHGFSGSGKSWLSEQLVASLPAVRVRSDLERKRLAGLATGESAASALHSGIYAPEFDRRTYDCLLEYAEIGVAAGFTVIIDATFLDAERRAPFLALAQRIDVPCAIVACQAPREVLEERIVARSRSGDRTSDADLAVLAHQLKTTAPFRPEESEHVVTADTSTTHVVADVTAAIRRWSESKN